MFRLAAIAAATLLIACSPLEDAPPAPAAATSSSASAAAQDSVITPWRIEGEYVVTHVDNAPPVINIAGHEPTITIGPRRIHFQSQCIYSDWTWEGAGENISTTPYYEPGSAMCARGLALGEQAIERAFGDIDRVRRIAGGLYVEGGGHTLQLRRVPSEAERAARAVDLTGEWRVAGIDGQPLDADYGIALSAGFREIWWEPACAGQGREYAIRANRFETLPPPDGPQEVCDIGYPEELPRIWSALDAADTIRRTPENGVLIEGGGRSVLLFSQ